MSSSPVTSLEVGGGLIGREAQIGGANLQQLAASSPPRQLQWWIRAGGEYQMHLRGQTLQQESHPVVDGPGLDEVVVVEHDHDIVGDDAEVIEHGSEDRFDRRLGRLQERQRVVPNRWLYRPQRRNQVRAEQHRIVVALVQ